jgi:FKBP-type peptidyl-prolyl cis-trans isomerase FklB
MVSSCSSETEVESEWHDWQARNDAATAQWAADNSLKKIKCYSKDPSVAGKNSDYIYVKVLEQGSGTESPLFTDTVRVAFQGRLIPSATYSKGFMFTYTYLGDFDWRTIGTSDGVTWRDGFYTAVQNMHIGDRWLVHIPYDLMYGAGSDTGYPAYSNMVFDIALVDFWHPGEKRPAFKSRQK